MSIPAVVIPVVFILHSGSQAPEAEPLRHLLVRLSGGQMKRNRPFTEPALLAGLWVLLAMLSVLEQYHPDDLRRFAALPFVRAGPECQPPCVATNALPTVPQQGFSLVLKTRSEEAERVSEEQRGPD